MSVCHSLNQCYFCISNILFINLELAFILDFIFSF